MVLTCELIAASIFSASHKTFEKGISVVLLNLCQDRLRWAMLDKQMEIRRSTGQLRTPNIAILQRSLNACR